MTDVTPGFDHVLDRATSKEVGFTFIGNDGEELGAIITIFTLDGKELPPGVNHDLQHAIMGTSRGSISLLEVMGRLNAKEQA